MRLIAFAILVLAAPAQTLVVESLQDPVPLDGTWRFHAADDPRFAQPDFDDSGWPGIRLPGAGPALGSGAHWLRLHVELPQPLPASRLAILLGPIGNAYDLFVNGERIGTFGDPRASGGWGQRINSFATFPLPQGTPRITIAIRTWQIGKSVFLPDYRESVWLGTHTAIAAKANERSLDRRWQTLSTVASLTATVVAGLFFLTVPLWRIDAREYFWCGLVLVLASILRAPQALPWMVEPGFDGSGGLVLPITAALFLITAAYLASWERLFRTLFGVTPSRTATSLVWVSNLSSTALGVLCLARWEIVGQLGSFYIVFFLVALGVTYLDVARRGAPLREAPVMHVGVALYVAANVIFYALAITRWDGFVPLGDTARIQSFSIEARSWGLLLFAGTMAGVLNRRSARVLIEQQRLTQELAAAAEMQALLMPSDAAQVRGFETDAAYLPASEVGGDFHYTLRDGDVLVVIVGDVSGKGLRSAMLVAVVVGILRETRERRPAAILAALNRAVAGQARGGFITCCCARFGAEITLANAGHLAPYADGREVDVEAGLPLGLDSGIAYSETIAQGTRFTFVSDGVVEAENAQRELFGFDRTREISTQSAQEIAQAAKAWGQTDDITAVTVRRTT